jgi:hypothetical protein
MRLLHAGRFDGHNCIAFRNAETFAGTIVEGPRVDVSVGRSIRRRLGATGVVVRFPTPCICIQIAIHRRVTDEKLHMGELL